MSRFYFDTSALVKNYHAEPGSSWVESILEARDEKESQSAHTIFIAEITIAETVAAFSVLSRTFQISRELQNAMRREFLKDVTERFVTIPLTRLHVDLATDLIEGHGLRGYDAIQLAVGISTFNVLKEDDLDLVFVTSDDQLLRAARAEGLAVENPSHHTN